MFGHVDWLKTLWPETPLIEIFVRGSLTYIAIFLLLRAFHKRSAGEVTVTDLLVLVLVADAAQNAMTGGYKSVGDGVLLVAVLISWSYAFDWMGYRYKSIEKKLVHPPPLDLVRNGRILDDNLRAELITHSELMTQLREQGIDDVKSVKSAKMEGDGRISVIREDNEKSEQKERRAGRG